ncbi:unnamed protein product [Brassicogethes aeneus]|uniref:Replication protein A subunit n=1 Tax=Brassicogethes aeneus TaxID=1431903 RepID=A0A9P0AQR4_BRAAE|nr:unnamed protein product [Brassicogethes aeneus]
MSGNYNLTEGALQNIMRGGDPTDPIVQVLGTKKIQNSSEKEKERYRLLLSDGKFTISFAMISLQPGERCIPNFSVIVLKQYITSVVNNASKTEQRILLVLEFEILHSGETVGKKLGTPTQLTDADSKPSSSSNGTLTAKTNGNAPSTYKPNSSSNVSVSDGVSIAGQLAHPISSLSPYHNKWVIKVRVGNKSAIRTWSNSKGEGKLFSCDFIDESGEIRCTAFRDLVDKFYEMLQIDKVYYVSKCQLKPANKQFNTVKNEYEMTMTNETVIQECLDADPNIPQTKYDFTPIDKLAHIEVGTLIDVIGVCKNSSELVTFQAKTTGRELKKREVTLIDQTRSAIALTLWGNDAESFDGTNNPVVVIKSAKLGEFGGGKNLSTIASSQMRINPELQECYRIRGWYDSEGVNIDATNISARSEMGNFNTPWMCFKDVQDQSLGNAEKGDYYQVMGTILLMRSENCIYKACPSEKCNKKIVDLETGMYRCEKCGTEYPSFKYRLLASMNVGDWSGNQWVSMFSNEAEKVLGLTAQEVGEQVDNQSQTMASIVDKANFKQFVLKCRAKMETYNDEARLKTVVVRVDPINYEEYNAHLIERIQALMSA